MSSRQVWWAAATIVALLAVAASLNSVGNGFVYDDNYVIVKAARTHSLAGWWRDFARTYWPEEWGGDGYRPLTVIAFRLQWVLGGGKPLLYHAVNVTLHVVTCGLVFWMAGGLLPVAAAFVAASLYAVHPVHVEAIANVVGQSELAVALLLTLAVGLYVHGRRKGALTLSRWVAIGALYVAACLFKEHGIVLPALLVLAEVAIDFDPSPIRSRLARVRLPIAALGAVGLAYFFARSLVVLGGGTGYVPFQAFQVIRFSSTDRILTALGVVPDWLRLLLWPARLTAEYSPQYVEIAQGPSVAQLPGLLVLAGVIGLAVACWRRSPATTFGIGWMVVTLLPSSNFVVPAGFIIAERTLLLPSVGAMIAIGSAVPAFLARVRERPALRYASAGALAILLALGLGRSITRNRVWRSDDSLFRQSVIDAPDSYRAHFVLGSYFFQLKDQRQSEAHYRRALQLFPHDPIVMLALAELYRGNGLCPPAIPLYRTAFAISPGLRNRSLGLAVCLLETLEIDQAREAALDAMRHGAPLREARGVIAAADAGRDSLSARRARGDTLPRSR